MYSGFARHEKHRENGPNHREETQLVPTDSCKPVASFSAPHRHPGGFTTTQTSAIHQVTINPRGGKAFGKGYIFHRSRVRGISTRSGVQGLLAAVLQSRHRSHHFRACTVLSNRTAMVIDHWKGHDTNAWVSTTLEATVYAVHPTRGIEQQAPERGQVYTMYNNTQEAYRQGLDKRGRDIGWRGETLADAARHDHDWVYSGRAWNRFRTSGHSRFATTCGFTSRGLSFRGSGAHLVSSETGWEGLAISQRHRHPMYFGPDDGRHQIASSRHGPSEETCLPVVSPPIGYTPGSNWRKLQQFHSSCITR